MKYWRSDVNADENHQHEPDQLRQGRPRSLSPGGAGYSLIRA